LTAAQKRFNTLIRQIEQARQTLAAWHENIAAYREAHGRVLVPLQTELLAGRRQWAFALDGLLAQPGWTKAERATLRELVRDAAGELLAARDDDTALKDLYDKHGKVDFDTERREAARAMKDLTEELTGLDLGDDEIHTQADLLERVQQGVQERAAAEQAQASARAARGRKGAAQQRREAEAQQATQSVREIFRKLASALHPDRESDERQRQAKTALMQRVNQAYAANDLLALLELQLEIEQIDPSHIANAGDARLKHYNKVLSEQLANLRGEIDAVEMGWRVEFALEPGWGMNPRRMGALLEETSRQWRADLAEQQRDMRVLSDAAATKRWLKRQQQLLREAEFDFAPF
jgi:hypothetical protein